MVLAAGTFTADLSFGARSSDVSQLQTFLKDEGVYSGPVTGFFGALTQVAVKKFQTQNGITPAVGYFGMKTRAVANAKLATSAGAISAPVSGTDQVAVLQKQIEALMAQLKSLQEASQAPAASSSAVSAAPTTTVNVPAPQPLPNPFVSPMTLISDFPSLTLSSYANVTLNEFRLSSVPEKVAITRFRLTNSGTFSDVYFNSINIVNSFTGEVLASLNGPVDKVAEFILTPNPAKTNKGLMVSGGTYAITASLLTPSVGGTKPNLEIDLNSASDVTAVDYDTLTRTADISKANSFPILGPRISTF